MMAVVKEWEKDGIRYSIRRSGHHCGYCVMPKVVKEPGYRGIITYVPVHGGITYAESLEDGSIEYGFDCAHAGDDHDPRTWDESWLAEQCERMARGILVAAQFEDEYLLADNEGRAEVLARYYEALGEDVDVTDNFGMMINLLWGEL